MPKSTTLTLRNYKNIWKIRVYPCVYSYFFVINTHFINGGDFMGYMIFNVYAKHHQKWMDNFTYTLKYTKKGFYFVFKVKKEDIKKIKREIRKHHLRYAMYEEKWERSSSYRKKFFKANKGPYRCRYCNRMLKKEYLVVDHIYPIAKGKYNKKSRKLLKLRGIKNVNDTRNLAASCFKCNEKKGDKLGLWYIRGLLGQYDWYWKTLKILKILIIIVIILSLIFIFLHFSNLNFHLQKIIKNPLC